MKRYLLALVPWMATAGAFGQTRPATVCLTYQGPLKTPAYRLVDECFVPADALRAAGWDVRLEGGRANIKAEGRLIDVPIRTIDGKVCLALRKAVDKLGGDSLWQEDELDVVAVVKSIKVHNGKIELNGSMNVRPSVSFIDGPNRIVVDFPGAKLSPGGEFEADSQYRIGQFQPNVVRIVIPSETMPRLPDISKPTAQFSLAIADLPALDGPQMIADDEGQGEKHVTVNQIPGEDDGSSGGLLGPPVPSNGKPAVTNLGPLNVKAESTDSLLISMKLAGALSGAPRVLRPEPNVLEVFIPNSDIHVADGFKLDADIVEQVATRREGDASVISLRTKRPVGIEVGTAPAEITIRMNKPNVGDGRLAGKLIVVDPGHGGHDNGAKAPDWSVLEKDLNLRFGKAVSQRLIEEGATVILTRKTDEFIPLTERAAIANRNHANFFISIHVNSNSLNNSTSGGITFYHLQNQTCQLLAQCIQHEIGKVSGLPSIGTWSDGKIYRSGFSVLRNSEVPAVLIETGFINHKVDRARLQTEEFRDMLALAVVRGLKTYLGDVKPAQHK